MSNTYLSLLLAFVLSCFLYSHTDQGWKGLVPLHSTRSEVELLLGPSDDRCRCLYKTANETVHADYADGRCRGPIPGWNVPEDTLLRLTIRSKTQKRFSDLNLDLSKYEFRQDDTFTKYYSSRQEGIEYSVLPDGSINAISYVPSTKDLYLRCAGFPLTDGSFTSYQIFDQYGNVEFNTELGRLDSFAVTLLRPTNLKGYIVVYAGRTACLGEASFRANRAKKYLITKRGLDPSRVVTIDGGYREEVSVELYAIPQDANPPDVVPTIAQSEVRIVRGKRCRLGP